MKFFHIIPCVAALFSYTSMGAQIAAQATSTQMPVAAPTSIYQSALFYALLLVAFVLLVFILQLSRILSSVASNYSRRKTHEGKATILLILVAVASLIPDSATAQEATAQFYHEGFGSNALNALVAIIVIELLVVLYYARMINLFVRKESAELPYVESYHSKPSFWDKFNKSVELQKEEAIMFDHSYDGIRELDNALPPWWRYGFYFTILFAIVYVLHFHVIKSGSLQLAEYDKEMTDAELAIEEYRKNASNFVDESNVVVLIEASDLDAGKTVFLEKCAVCHGQKGEGLVGPNFADQYWIYGGDIKSIFTTIKYGATAKGMQSWKEQLGAKQMAQVASYIMTLQGTNPPNPKAPQGTLYVPESTSPADTTAAPTDTTVVSADTTATAQAMKKE